jgi:hypothetical protein
VVKGCSGTPASLYLEFWGIERGAPRLLAVQTAPAFATDWQNVEAAAVAPAGTVHVNMLIYGTLAAEGVPTGRRRGSRPSRRRCMSRCFVEFRSVSSGARPT